MKYYYKPSYFDYFKNEIVAQDKISNYKQFINLTTVFQWYEYIARVNSEPTLVFFYYVSIVKFYKSIKLVSKSEQ